MEQSFQEEKKNYCYGLMPGDFQIICGSMVGENRRSPVSTESPDLSEIKISRSS